MTEDEDLFPAYASKEDELEDQLWILRQQLLAKMRRPPDGAMRAKLKNVYGVKDWYTHFLKARKGRRAQFRKGSAELRQAIASEDAVAAALAMYLLLMGFEGAVREFETDQLFQLAFSSHTGQTNKKRATVTIPQIENALLTCSTMDVAAASLGITRQAISKRIPKERRQLLRGKK